MHLEVPYFASLGRPLLIGHDGDPVAAKTRKAVAILGFLSRVSDMSAARETLADLLWSSAPRQKGMQSLRQALKQLKTAENQAGLDAVISTSGHIELDQATLRTDFQHLDELLAQGDSDGFEAAQELWRGEFLSGFDDLDPQFSEWLHVERERIKAEVVGATLKHLTAMAIDSGAPYVETGANFLLHIDPAFESAHRVLIRFYQKQGQPERAEQQFKACERELKELDLVPDAETVGLLAEQSGSASQNLVGELDKPQNPGFWRRSTTEFLDVDPEHSDNVVHFPHISIISPHMNHAATNDQLHLKEEIVGGLSAYRAFDLYDGEYFGDLEGPQPILVQGDETGSYLLRFQHNERNGKVSVQFEDRSEGRIVFSEIVDLREWDGVQTAASHTIGRIHTYVTKKLRNPKNGSAFARWCQAEALMVNFDPVSDRKALQILSELERQHSTFSMSYSGKALVNIKQLLHYRVEDRSNGLTWDEILGLCEHAVMLDPWQPINQRAHGWALIQSSMPDQARRAFLQAIRLNSVDPINLISAAEGLAFAGEVGLAREKAELAMSLFTTVPRVFYEYYSLVFFAAEDFDTAAKIIERASYKSVVGLTTRVAALVCAGKEAEALELMRRQSDSLSSIVDKAGLGTGDPEEWARRINFFQDPKTRAAYGRGVDLVKRYFFGDRASLG